MSLVTLATLVAVIRLDQRHNLAGATGRIILSAVLLSLVAMAAGWSVGRLAGSKRVDRFTLLLEFAARNLAMAAVVGIMVLERAEFVLFATLFFLAQLPIVLLMVGAYAVRSNRRGLDPGNPSIRQ